MTPRHLLLLGVDAEQLAGVAAAVEMGIPGARMMATEQVRRISDSLLRELGWTRDGPDAVPPRPHPSLSTAVEKARADMDADPHDGVIVLADPAVEFLLPWWREILGDTAVAIVFLQPAAEYAWRMGANGMPIELAAALWAARYRHILDGSSGMAVALVRAEGGPAAATQALGRIGLGEVGGDAVTAAWPQSGTRLPDDWLVPHPSAKALAERIEAVWPGDPVSLPGEAGAGSPALPLPPAPEPWEVALLTMRRFATRANDDAAEARRLLEETRIAIDTGRVDNATMRGQIETLTLELAMARATAPAQPDGATPTTGKPPTRKATAASALVGQPRTAGGLRRVLSGARRVGRRALPALFVNPLFDAAWYRERYPDAPRGTRAAWRHYRRTGRNDGRAPNPLFDMAWYLRQYPDVAKTAIDPLDHYLLFGWRENRDPSDLFNTGWYLAEYRDVRDSGANPLLHFLRFGLREGRLPKPLVRN